LEWAVTYVVAGVKSVARWPGGSWPEFLLTPIAGYPEILEFLDVGDVSDLDDVVNAVTGPLLSLPVNVLVAWIAAHVVAFLTTKFLDVEYGGMVYLVFGVLTLIEIGVYRLTRWS